MDTFPLGVPLRIRKDGPVMAKMRDGRQQTTAAGIPKWSVPVLLSVIGKARITFPAVSAPEWADETDDILLVASNLTANVFLDDEKRLVAWFGADGVEPAAVAVKPLASGGTERSRGSA